MARPEDEASDDDDDGESSDSLLREAARIDASSLDAAPVLRTPGSRIGRFVVRGELGRGGMGVVYRAFDDTLNRSVALKVLPVLGGAKADEAKVRLLREARAAASLEHPHVVAIYDVGEDAGAPFIAMELVVGQSLRERMRDPSTLEEKIGWLSEVAEALGAAHDKGIVHRDVKPENVMIKRDGRVKVLDFGIARQAATPIDPSAPTEASGERLGTITEEGARVGTPRYMAPEQLKGDKLDGRCDQFAWGVVAYELFAGRPPWEASDAVSLIAKILGDEAPPLAEVAPDVPNGIAAVVARALSKSPKDRFASMNEVAAALVREREGEPRPRPAAAHPPRWLPRIALISLAASVLVGATLAWRHPWSAASSTRLASPFATKEPRAADGPPLPASANPEAARAFTSSVQRWHDGDWNGALGELKRATTLDGAMGAAWLRLAIYGGGTRVEVSDRFAKAAALRSSMNERDRALLDAEAPSIARHPPDDRETHARLARLALERPDDYEIAEQLGNAALVALDDAGEATREAERALALDASFVPAYALKEGALVQLRGDYNGVLGVAKECEAHAPGSPGCAKIELDALLELGQCEALGRRANAALALRSADTSFRLMQASSLETRGGPSDAVRAAFKGAAPPDWRDYERAIDIWVDEYVGDFAGTMNVSRAWLAVLSSDASASNHVNILGRLVEAALEADRPAEAANAVEAYLRVREGLVGDESNDVEAVWQRVPMLIALRRTGRLSQAELERKTADLAGSWEGRVARSQRADLWAQTYGSIVSAPADAESALARVTGEFQNGSYLLDSNLRVYGRALLIAGRTDDALKELERLGRRCVVPYAIVDHVQGLLWLGKAREAKGQTSGACEAYATVIARWGNAKPKSVTADEAKKRSQALGCAR